MVLSRSAQKCMNAPLSRYARRALIGLTLSFSLLGTAYAEPGELIEEKNFQALSVEMQKQKLPLLLMLHADYCDYCRQLKKLYLEPMERSGDYTGRILLRQLDIHSGRKITGFGGQVMLSGELADSWKVIVTPTLLFLDAEGRELAERMLGFNSPDFYGAYLERAIEQAIKNNAAGTNTVTAETNAQNGGTPADAPPKGNN